MNETISILKEGNLTSDEEIFVAQFLLKKENKQFVDLMRKVMTTCEESRRKKIYSANSNEDIMPIVGEARVFEELGKLFDSAQIEDLLKAMTSTNFDSRGNGSMKEFQNYFKNLRI